MQTRRKQEHISQKVDQIEDFLTNLVQLNELDPEGVQYLLQKSDSKHKRRTSLSKAGASKSSDSTPRRSARLGRKPRDEIPIVPDQQNEVDSGCELETDKMRDVKVLRKRRISIDSNPSKKRVRDLDTQVPQVDSTAHSSGRKKKRCNYCQTSVTPMWRHGPEHCPVLCNSCGVKFKRGRILQEPIKEVVSIPSPAPTELHSPGEEKPFDLPLPIDRVPSIETGELEKSFQEIFEPGYSMSELEPDYLDIEKRRTKFYPCARMIPSQAFRQPNHQSQMYVSDFDKPLPVKVPCVLSDQTEQNSSYYPEPQSIQESNERYQYLSEKMTSAGPEKIAQLLCILDPRTRDNMLMALKLRRDVHFDVTSISDSVWIEICELFGH
jgi:hypothetical protein